MCKLASIGHSDYLADAIPYEALCHDFPKATGDLPHKAACITSLTSLRKQFALFHKITNEKPGMP